MSGLSFFDIKEGDVIIYEDRDKAFKFISKVLTTKLYQSTKSESCTLPIENPGLMVEDLEVIYTTGNYKMSERQWIWGYDTVVLRNLGDVDCTDFRKEYPQIFI